MRIIDKNPKLKDLSWEEKGRKAEYRGLHTRFPEQLKDLPDMFNDKIKRLEEIRESELEQYAELLLKYNNKIKKKDIEELDNLRLINEKIARLQDKQISCLAELDIRKHNKFKRKDFHKTIYYIDLNAGNDGNTGLNIAQSWRTIERYTVTLVKIAGDIAYVRANTTEIPAGIINFDEDGTADDLLYIIGCDSVVNDPWGDGSDVLPIIDFNNANVYCYFLIDNFWQIERFDITNYNNTAGGIYSNISKSLYVKDCKLHLNNNGNGLGIYLLRSAGCRMDGVEVYDNNQIGIKASQCRDLKIINSTLNAGVINQERWGIQIEGTTIEIENSSIGQTSAYLDQDIRTLQSFMEIKMRNVIWNRTINCDAYSDVLVSEEDAQQVYGDQFLTLTRDNFIGTVEKDNVIVRAGGASSSAKMTPGTAIGLHLPLTLNGNLLFRKKLNWYLQAGTAYTITTFIRATAAWGTYPTADELYVEYSYLSNAGNATRTKIRSAQVLSHPSNWVGFTVTFTPLQDGWAYGDVFLKVYEAGKSINVDIKQSIV